MRSRPILIAIAACSSAIHAQDLQPLIARPITLPRGAVDLTLHGTYTNWAAIGGAGSTSLTGGTIAAAADVGISDATQIGAAAAFPISPGAAFGSALVNAAFALDPEVAARLDAGFERTGLNGAVPPSQTNHANRFVGGLGARVRFPISPTLAFVGGRGGAVHFGHFNNIGATGTGLYLGSSTFTELSSDFIVVAGGDGGTPTVVGISLPGGLLLQPDPHFALTLDAGYSAVTVIPKGATNTGATLHFIPIGMEAILTPAAPLDVGARFFIDGYVASSNSRTLGVGYFDLRALMFWLRVRA